jgi:hypothetical protein
MTLYARKLSQPSNDVSCRTTQPQVNMPNAVPPVPMSEYQAKISLRVSGSERCASVDSSIARKGPISLPLYNIMLAVNSELSLMKSIPGADDTENRCCQ